MKCAWFALLLSGALASSDGCMRDAEVLATVEAANPQEQPRPSGQENDEALEIKIGFKVSSFNIVPHTSSVEVDGILTRTWKNQAMHFAHLNPCRNVISISQLKSKLWRPPLAFVNAFGISMHQHSVVIRLHEDGTIHHTERVKQSIPCKTHALEYPFGNTTCTMLWRNDDFTRNTARIMWIEGTEQQEAHEGFATFTTNLSSSNTSNAGDLHLEVATVNETEVYMQHGLVDELTLTFHFARGHHKILLLFYVPSITFMFIAWLSLCLGPMAITRSILLIGSLVLLMIHYSTNMAGLPQTNGVTAVDIWKIFSFLFVNGIICELIIVTLMASFGRSRRWRSCGKRTKRKGNYSMEPLYEEMNDLRERNTRRTCGCCRVSALLLDFVGLWVAAAVFLAFCLFYYTESSLIVKWTNDFDVDVLRII